MVVVTKREGGVAPALPSSVICMRVICICLDAYTHHSTAFRVPARERHKIVIISAFSHDRDGVAVRLTGVFRIFWTIDS